MNDLAARLAKLDAWPGDPVVDRTVQDLARMDRWQEAVDRGRAALRAGVPRRRVLLSLAAGAVEARRADRALKSLDQLKDDPHPDVIRARVAALRAAGRADEAQRLVEQHLLDHPGDDEISAIFQAIRADDVLDAVSGVLPLETLSRAERILAAGQPGRALRLLRRLSLDHPGDARLDSAIRLAARAVEAEGAELEDPLRGVALPELSGLDGSVT